MINPADNCVRCDLPITGSNKNWYSVTDRHGKPLISGWMHEKCARRDITECMTVTEQPPPATEPFSIRFPELVAHVAEIRRLGKRVVRDVIEIGRRLTECKDIVGHGNWLPWLEREFGWTDKTAENFINVSKAAGKFENFSNLNIPVSGLYLLAAPNTPDEAKAEVIERAEKGEKLSVADVKTTIANAKTKQPTTRKQSTAKRNGASTPDEPPDLVEDPEINPDMVEYPEIIKKNLLDTIDQHCAVVRAYKKV